ncbi:hypothetical protein N566_06845 [Streptomycetaceae bacterium MP113-05]|nr:hypothetical protein N566_06845 [Streptomycetaceae bacterium MP113-05]
MSYLIRQTSPADPAVRLVCFPHAGGSASFFRSWSRHLPPTVELLSVQYPGRESRFSETLIPSMAPLSSAVAQQLLTLAPVRTVLFGHSMGAAVAYETLLRLEDAGAAHFTRLCVSGRSLTGAPGKAVRTDEEVIEAVRSLGGTNGLVFDDPDLRDMLLPIIRNDYQLIDTYRRSEDAPILRAGIIAMTGDKDPQVAPREAEEWSTTTIGSFSLSVFDGDHFYLVSAAERVARLAVAP